MSRKTGIYVYASGKAKEQRSDVREEVRKAKVLIAVTAETVIYKFPAKAEDKYDQLDAGTEKTLELEPGIYRVQSAEPVTLTELGGENAAFATVTNVMTKDDWPDPPKKLWDSEAMLKELREYVAGELH